MYRRGSDLLGNSTGPRVAWPGSQRSHLDLAGSVQIDLLTLKTDRGPGWAPGLVPYRALSGHVEGEAADRVPAGSINPHGLCLSPPHSLHRYRHKGGNGSVFICQMTHFENAS